MNLIMKGMNNLTAQDDSVIIAHRHSCPQVSVHVLIYNGSWERVRATLNSVIMQKGIDFEVIVMDDCSKVNHSDRIKDFFSRHNFTNYRLINHEKNLGTVKTCLEAAELSRAEYTRGLGQGDMFFDEYALRDSYNFMVETDAEVMISKAVWYHAFTNPMYQEQLQCSGVKCLLNICVKQFPKA